MNLISSLIQTILSVPELHRISHLKYGSRTVTAGREFCHRKSDRSHPAPKNLFNLFLYFITWKYTCQRQKKTRRYRRLRDWMLQERELTNICQGVSVTKIISKLQEDEFTRETVRMIGKATNSRLYWVLPVSARLS